ncbi:phage protein [Streptococcus dysgalactiae]|nr:phage protein [Streptococcus dysgalactiae]
MIPKFRAWNPYEEKMIDDKELVIWGGNIYRGDRDKIFQKIIKGKKGLIGYSFDDEYLMQSTGLKDKNDVEIFDGDVVNFMVPNQMISGTYQIRQAKSGEWRLDNRVQGRPLYISGSYHCEVVGNVWEDGDLLESVEE